MHHADKKHRADTIQTCNCCIDPPTTHSSTSPIHRTSIRQPAISASREFVPATGAQRSDTAAKATIQIPTPHTFSRQLPSQKPHGHCTAFHPFPFPVISSLHALFGPSVRFFMVLAKYVGRPLPKFVLHIGPSCPPFMKQLLNFLHLFLLHALVSCSLHDRLTAPTKLLLKTSVLLI